MTSISVRTVSQSVDVVGKLIDIAESLGIQIKNEWSRDVSFIKGVISVGHSDSLFEQEEKLAHELGHFLVAPKSRRWKKNYGHPEKVDGGSIYEKEELAASVLGMTLQRWCGGRFNMNQKAYLWNDNSYADSWYPYGFWIGAGILVEKGWLLGGFELNVEKLKEACKWEKSRR